MSRWLVVGALGLLGAACSAEESENGTAGGGAGAAGAAGVGQGGSGGSAGSGNAGEGGGIQTDAKPFSGDDIVVFSVKDFSSDATFDLREMPYKEGFGGLEYEKLSAGVLWKQGTRCYYLNFELGAPLFESNPVSVGPREYPIGTIPPATEARVNFNESDTLLEDGTCPMQLTGVDGTDAYLSMSGSVKLEFADPENPNILRLEFVDLRMEQRFFFDENGKVPIGKAKGSFKADVTFVLDNSKFSAD